MNDKNGLVTLAAFLTVAMVIVVAALLGIYRYGVVARVSSLGAIPAEPQPDLAASGPQLSPDPSASTASLGGLDRQRLRILESILAEKTELVRRQSQQITDQHAAMKDLEQRLDDAMMVAIESLQDENTEQDENAEQDENTEQGGSTEQDTAAADTETSAVELDSVPLDPDQLAAELILSQALHDAMTGDLATLHDELDEAYEQLARLKDEASIAAADQLRDAVALDAASAEVLRTVGQDAIPGLIDALAHVDPVVRRWAATVLGEMGSDASDVIGALGEALSDQDPSVRRAAKSALDEIER